MCRLYPYLLAACLALAACSGSPAAPTSPGAPAPATAPSSQPFQVDLPVAAGDSASHAYGIWPFGVHGASHAHDGHPGWDVEFRPGAPVRAAADGTLLHATSDSQSPGRFTIRINHSDNRYATDYTNVSDLMPGIGAGTTVTRGQPLGTAGVQTQFIGTSEVTWGMTHFQVNDFSRNEGLTNPNAVNPEAFLTAAGRSLFEGIWRASAYQAEFCEPFPGNSRLNVLPLTRNWSLRSGSLPARLDVRCVSDGSMDYEYTLRGADGAVAESGIMRVNATVKPLPTVDMRPFAGATRLGVYDIVSGTMELNLGAPGGSRPSSLSGASTYTTTP